MEKAVEKEREITFEALYEIERKKVEDLRHAVVELQEKLATKEYDYEWMFMKCMYIAKIKMREAHNPKSEIKCGYFKTLIKAIFNKK